MLRSVPAALLAGLLLARSGLVCFAITWRRAPTAATTATGFALCVGAAALWAGSNVVVRLAQKSTPRFDVIAFMVCSSLVPIVPFVLLSLAFDPPATRWRWSAAPWSSWVSLAYLGWFATILAYALWTGLLKRHPANRVAPFSLAVPLVGISSGMLVLGESVSNWQWAGTALVVAALATVIGARWLGQLR
jgi:O-acetylserine/cysteine efflux transporter